MFKPDISIIIVSWNVRDLLKNALLSLTTRATALNLEIVVIDNNSVDGTTVMIQKDFPSVKLVANNSNLGFSRACHQGVSLSNAEHLLFLNPDTEVFDYTLDKALNFIKQKPVAGAVGCRLMNRDRTQQPSVRSDPSMYSLLILLTKAHNFFPWLLKKYLQSDFDYNETQIVSQIMGAFILTPRNVWVEYGGFDKKFFIWFEEVDYCRRLRQKYQIWYYSDASIMHHGGASFGLLKALPEQRIFNASLLLYARKHLKTWQYYFIYVFQPVSLVLTLIVGLLDRMNINPKKK